MDKLADLVSKVLHISQDLSKEINPHPKDSSLTKQIESLVCNSLIISLQYAIKNSFEESIKITEERMH